MRTWAMGSRAGLVLAVTAAAVLGWLVISSGADPSVSVVDAAQGRSGDRAINEAPRGRPVMADQAAVEASLQALERNGVLDQLTGQARAAGLTANDGAMAGRGLLPIFHVVDCAEEACGDVVSWAETNGLEPSEVLIHLGHGGVEEFYVELSDHIPPAAPQLVRHTETVMAGIADIDGAVYVEWMADNRANVRGGGR